MKRDWTSRSALIVIALILVAVNLAGLNLFARLDLTDDNVYSLSDASINILENLEDPVTVLVYFSDDLPAPYSSNRRFLKDKLDDYRAYGGVMFEYRFENPNDAEELRAQAAENQIPPVQIQVIEADNVQLKNAYMGVVIKYAGSTERIPVIQDLSRLEYDITGAIRRLTRTSVPKVGFLTGHGEASLETDMQVLNQSLTGNYAVAAVTGVGDLGDLDALLIVAPTDTIPLPIQKGIDNYIMGGGRVAFLLNDVSGNLQSGQASTQNSGLDAMLLAYGMATNKDLVMDNQSSSLTVQRQQGMFNLQQQVPYPFFPVATSFSGSNMMVNRLSTLMFYFVSSIDTSIVIPEGVTRTVLVSSTSRSQTQEGFFFVQPSLNVPEFSSGPYPLMAAYEGEFASAFDENRIGISSRLVLVGDGDLLKESLLGVMRGNIQFGLNLVDWLVQDEALLGIRSKNIAARPLRETSASIRPWIKYGNMLGPVLIVILFGLVRWRIRKSRIITLASAPVSE